MQTEELVQQLVAQGPKKRWLHPGKAALGLLAFMLVYYGLIVGFSNFRTDLAVKFKEPLYLLEVGCAFLSGLTALFAANWLALPDVGQRPHIRFLPFLPLGALLGLQLYMMSPLSWDALYECLKLELYMPTVRIMLYGLFPAAIVFFVMEKAAPIRCCWAGSMAALAVACFGYILLRLTDGMDDPMRVAMWYFMPVGLMAVVGMMAGGMTLKRVWR
ncbi:MAG: DUF1109 family protein [Alphaproteobacteria bacterium]|nr:DUF1109 family protein [Alphaproteobacteria bacterium]